MVEYNPYSLESKTILITGASSGIGREVAIQCSKMGARVFVSGRNKEELETTVSMLVGEGHEYMVCDLENLMDIDLLAAKAPMLNGLVNNAGTMRKKMLPFINENELNTVLRVNAIAPILLTNLLVKKKKMMNPSSIVFTSSISGTYQVSPGNSIYSTSKAAINGFMKNAALDLAPKGIRCNSVNPGMVETGFIDKQTITEEQWEVDIQNYPLKRHGKPIDIALAIVFLLSDASSWITGTAMLIDGGLTLK